MVDGGKCGFSRGILNLREWGRLLARLRRVRACEGRECGWDVWIMWGLVIIVSSVCV